MKVRRRLLQLLFVLLLLVGAGFLMLPWLERHLVYHPTPAADGWQPPPPATTDVWLTSADGTRLHAWWLPHAREPAGGAVLVCHGNAGNLSHRGPLADTLRDTLGRSVLVFDYPGYGKSDGSPSETGCYAAADAAHQWLTETAGVPGDRIVLYGESLGGGVAVDVAQRLPNRAVVLVKTFTSLPAAAKVHFPWLPTDALMGERYQSDFKIARLTTPVFVAHGTADEVVPFAHGEALFWAANPPKRFLPLPGDRHNNPLPAGFFEGMKRFLDEQGQ